MTATILVVEDEALVAMELEESLALQGYRVAEVVVRGEDVLAAFSRCSPDLVLMDIRVGGVMDGIDAAVQIRRISDVPLVFLTASNDPQTLARAALVRSDGLLIKPISDQELAHKVSTVLARYR